MSDESTLGKRIKKLDQKLDGDRTWRGIKRTRIRLKTIGDVLSEHSRNYRALRKGEIDVVTARTRTAMLDSIRGTIEIGEVSARLDRLEEQLARPQDQQSRVVALLRERVAAKKAG